MCVKSMLMHSEILSKWKCWERWKGTWKTTCHFGELWYCPHNGVLGTEAEHLGGGLLIRS